MNGYGLIHSGKGNHEQSSIRTLYRAKMFPGCLHELYLAHSDTAYVVVDASADSVTSYHIAGISKMIETYTL